MNYNYNILYVYVYQAKKVLPLVENSFNIISDVYKYSSMFDMISNIYEQIGCTFFDPKKENRNGFFDVMKDTGFWEKYDQRSVTRIIFGIDELYKENPLFYAEVISIILPISLYGDKKIILIGESIDEYNLINISG